MRVLIDGRPLYDESSVRGFGRYVKALVPRLISRGVRIGALVVPGTAVPPGAEPVHVRRFAPGRLAYTEHRTRLPFDLQRWRSDVYWSTSTHPPRRCDRPWVQTLYDVIPVVDQRPEHAMDRRRWRTRARAIRSATAWAAISAHSADECSRVLGLDRDRVRVVHCGVDPVFRPPNTDHTADPPFLLYVGMWGPNKGFAEAFEVISALGNAGYPHRLKVVGHLDGWSHPRVLDVLRSAARPDLVDLLGYVDDSTLARLYWETTALVVTSRAEGFCLPAAEAMASGTAVVAFANTAITETVGDGGLLVPDGRVADVVQAVRRVVDDVALRAELAVRGPIRAGRFSWDRAADDYVDIFAQAAGTPPG